MSRLIRRTSRGSYPTDFDTVAVISPWFWRRTTGPQGGHTSALGGLYLHGWGKALETFAGRRFWCIAGLVSLHHRDTENGKLRANKPGWSWRFAQIAPTLNFKKAENYGGW